MYSTCKPGKQHFVCCGIDLSWSHRNEGLFREVVMLMDQTTKKLLTLHLCAFTCQRTESPVDFHHTVGTVGSVNQRTGSHHWQIVTVFAWMFGYTSGALVRCMPDTIDLNRQQKKVLIERLALSLTERGAGMFWYSRHVLTGCISGSNPDGYCQGDQQEKDDKLKKKKKKKRGSKMHFNTGLMLDCQ